MLYEINFYDCGDVIGTGDFERPLIGETIDWDGIEVKVVKIVSIDDDSQTADVEIEYVV